MYPDEVALIELRPGGKMRREITWGQFDQRVNRVANALMSVGIEKGDRVIHLMMNSIDWLEAYFGIIRTGAWAVPLSYRFTTGDIKYCADIAEAKAIIFGEEFTDSIESIRPQLSTTKDYIFAGQNLPKDMTAYEDMISRASSEPPEIQFNDEDGCALYFTSGTTGAPKPILLSHKNLECTAITENYRQRITHDDNYLLLQPLYHTGPIGHWLGSMMVGGVGTLLIGVSPQYIFEVVQGERITVAMLLVPWIQDILVAMDRGELRKEDYDLSSWRLMHSGAQPVPPSLIKRWKEYFPNMQYDTSYGLSESAGPGCINLGIENERKLGAIGKPGFNWEARIVDDKGKDVTSGEVGELLVKGNGVMKEYYKNPELTAQTIKNGWLYTGDIARVDGDGFIYLVDRRKDVIITGGENIYPLEVEEVLRSHPKIYDVAVIGIPDERLGEIALAVIEPKPGQTLTEGEIQVLSEQSLPRYKRPRRIVFDKVPRNPAGKIEKPKMRQKYAGLEESFKI